MNSKSTRYTEVKNVFEKIKNTLPNVTFGETEQTSTLYLKAIRKGVLLEYYYISGNAQVYRYIDADNLTPLTTIPDRLETILIDDLKEV